MKKSEILKTIKKYKEKGFDPTITGTAGWSCGMGGFTCPICKKIKGFEKYIHNKNNGSIGVCDECFRLFFPPYKVKKILITSGGTKEYIDSVRVLTNISTGKLGSLIFKEFDTCNNDLYCLRKNPVPLFEIHFVYVKGSEKPSTWDQKNAHFYEVIDVQSVYKIMEELVPEMDVIIHPMAVSDFGFHPTDKKLKSNSTDDFIQSLKERIYQTPKILSKIKEWNPNCFLISFKFENGLNYVDLINTAFESLTKNDCDVVIANDKKEMIKFKTHISHFCMKKDSIESVTKIEGKEEIAKEIYYIVNKI